MPGTVYRSPKVTLADMTPLPDTSADSSPFQPALRLYQDATLTAYYAPMEYVTPGARVVLCGITPGATQALTALDCARQILEETGSVSGAQHAAKHQAGFVGARASLVAMLDAVMLNQWLGLASCASLFEHDAGLLHCTNVLRHPVVLASGRGYNGTPAPHRHGYLTAMLETCLHAEIRALGEQALWLPLGRAAADALSRCCDAGLLHSDQLLAGLPHPSGANRERILYFTGQKPRTALSRQTNPDMLDNAKQALIDKIRNC